MYSEVENSNKATRLALSCRYLCIGLCFCNINIHRLLAAVIHLLKDVFLINARGAFAEEPSLKKIL